MSPFDLQVIHAFSGWLENDRRWTRGQPAAVTKDQWGKVALSNPTMETSGCIGALIQVLYQGALFALSMTRKAQGPGGPPVPPSRSTTTLQLKMALPVRSVLWWC